MSKSIIEGDSGLNCTFGRKSAIRRSAIACSAFLTLTLGACSTVSGLFGANGAPLTQAQLQANLQNAVYLMDAAGCAVSSAAKVAQPIVSIGADATGNQVLSAVGAGGAILCSLTVPASALPVPAAPGAPAASVPVAAVPATPAS